MRTYLTIVLITLISLSCLTVDPPRPVELGAPQNLSAVIVNFDSSSNAPGEYIHIKWEKNVNDTISTASYTLLKYTDTTGTSGKITNIPSNVNSYFDPLSESYTSEFRAEEKIVAIAIVGIDTLGRPGDTTALCSVSVAPSVILSSPGLSISDTIENINFKWFVRKVPDQTITFVSLWHQDSIIWSSTPDSLYTGGEELTAISELLPDSFLPLSVGTYNWIVSLKIVTGEDDPKSFTARELNVLSN